MIKKPEPHTFDLDGKQAYAPDPYGDWHKVEEFAPYRKGETLWVRETWCQDARGGKEENGEDAVYYRADMISNDIWKGYWKPSIFMPKWACRLFLNVESVHVERLQDISESDSLAEGVKIGSMINGHVFTAKELFQGLWDSINGKQKKNKQDVSWKANPYVWVIKFSVNKESTAWQLKKQLAGMNNKIDNLRVNNDAKK